MDEERNRVVAEVITKARLINGQPQLEDASLLFTVQAWVEVLAEIPTDQLNDYYVKAAQAKHDTFPLGALDIIKRWNADDYGRLMAQAEAAGWKGFS